MKGVKGLKFPPIQKKRYLLDAAFACKEAMKDKLKMLGCVIYPRDEGRAGVIAVTFDKTIKRLPYDQRARTSQFFNPWDIGTVVKELDEPLVGASYLIEIPFRARSDPILTRRDG